MILHKNIIKKGSKTFYFASYLLPKTIRDQAWALYTWCRISDDLIDQNSSSTEAMKHLKYLNDTLEQVFSNQESPLIDFEKYPEIAGLSYLKQTKAINPQYLKDLLRGYQMDVIGFTPSNEEELIDYCYCVAGTVGLMMAQIMNVTDKNVLICAKNLGIAFQLTNIMRDLSEDLNLGRIYVPLSFFKTQESIEKFKQLDLQTVANVRKYLYQLSQPYYKSGFHGMQFLSLQNHLAIMTAAMAYQQIGEKIIKNNPSPEKRIYTHFFEKVIIAIKALFKVLKFRIKKLISTSF